MRRYRRAVVAAAASGLLCAGVLAGVTVAASASTFSAHCENQATNDPTCTVQLTVAKPLSFTVQVTAVPAKSGVLVDWTVSCPVNGTYPATSTCSGTSAAETWKFHGGMCANARGAAVSGSKIILWPCTGSANEIWTHKSNGEYVLKAGHGKLCLDDPRSSTANGTQLIVYTCTNTPNQHWTLPGR